METCPDCTYVEEQVKGNDNYEIIDIGKHVKNLKAFLKLRDNNPVFDEAKQCGAAGIPCFVLEDGTVTLTPEEAPYDKENPFPARILRFRRMYSGLHLETKFRR